MHPYIAFPLIALACSAGLVTAILTRGSGSEASRVGATITAAAGFWAFCQVMWTTAADADQAMAWVRTSYLGYGFLGPLAVHLFASVTGARDAWIRPLVRVLYGVALAYLGIAWTTGWFHADVVLTSWGWGYTFGPAYLSFYLYTLGCVGLALWIGYRGYRTSLAPAERAQAALTLLGVMVPLVVVSVTDSVLPLMHIQVPRLGTLSFVFLAVMLAWSFHRYGYPILAPGGFDREILDSLREGVAFLRLDGTVRSVNGGMARLVGAPASAIAGRPIAEIVPGDLADCADRDSVLVSDRGERIPVSVSVTPLHDKQRQEIGLVLTVRDQREVVGLQNKLVLSARLAAIGELAAGIAHEINNPTAFVRSNLNQLRKGWREVSERLRGEVDAPQDPHLDALLGDGEEMIDEAIEGVERTTAIVRDVLNFAHPGPAQLQLVDLNDLLDGVLRFAGPHLRDRAHIVRDYGEVPPVRATPQKLKQVFLNLLMNACRAVAGEGQIVLSSREVDGRVCVTVADDGCGMPSEVIQRIFDPFFTTNAAGEGLGLGLSISYQIVRDHGGEVQVESRPGEGTTFRVWLPAASRT